MIQEGISDFFAQFFEKIGNKVKSDIRKTSAATQELNRRVKRTSKIVTESASAIIDDVSELPSILQQLSNRSDTWALVASGMVSEKS
jgi:hypothetical protein